MSHEIRKIDALRVKLAAANQEQRIQELRFLASNETSSPLAADPLLKCSTLGRRSPDCLFICRRFQMEQDLSQLRATVVFVPADHPSARRQSGLSRGGAAFETKCSGRLTVFEARCTKVQATHYILA